VTVEEGAEVINSVIFPGARIKKGAVVRKAIIGSGASVGCGAYIGDSECGDDSYLSEYCTDGISLIGNNIIITDGHHLPPGSMVARNILPAEVPAGSGQWSVINSQKSVVSR